MDSIPPISGSTNSAVRPTVRPRASDAGCGAVKSSVARKQDKRVASAHAVRVHKKPRVDVGASDAVIIVDELHAKITELERAKAASDARADAAVAEATGLRAQLKRQSDTEDMSDHAAMTLYEAREIIKAFVSAMTDIVAEVGREHDICIDLFMKASNNNSSADTRAASNATERVELDLLRAALTAPPLGDGVHAQHQDEFNARLEHAYALLPALREVDAMMKTYAPIDPRIRIALQDNVKNLYLGLTDSLSRRVAYTIASEAFKLRYFTFERKHMLKVGEVMAAEKKPTLQPHMQYVGGALCYVNTYGIEDLARMHKTIIKVMNDPSV